MDLKTKNFVLDKLLEAIKNIHSTMNGTTEITDKIYDINLRYIDKILDILLKDYLPQEHKLIKENINLIDSQDSSNYRKQLDICAKMIKLANDIIENY